MEGRVDEGVNFLRSTADDWKVLIEAKLSFYPFMYNTLYSLCRIYTPQGNLEIKKNSGHCFGENIQFIFEVHISQQSQLFATLHS